MQEPKKYLIDNKIYIINNEHFLFNLMKAEDSEFYNPNLMEEIKYDKRKLSKYEITKDLNKNIDKYDELEVIDIMLIQEQESKKRQKIRLKEYRKNINKIRKIYEKDTKIASIDTEFEIRGDNVKIFHIGYTIKNLKTNQITIKDFIVEDEKKKKYIIPNKTFSVIKPLKEILKIVEKDLEDVSLIIGNNISSEYKMFQIKGFHLPEDKIFEISDLVHYITKQSQHDLSVSTMSVFNKIFTTNLHNPSNDSFYTIKNFTKLINKINNGTYSELNKDINNIFGKHNKQNRNNVSNLKKEIKNNENYSFKKQEISKELASFKIETFDKTLNEENFLYTDFYKVSTIIEDISIHLNIDSETIYKEFLKLEKDLEILIMPFYTKSGDSIPMPFIDRNNMKYLLKSFNVDSHIDLNNSLKASLYPTTKHITKLNNNQKLKRNKKGKLKLEENKVIKK